MATVASINELGGYSFNPRGNLWFNDESSYGRKLLLKMGWSKGKGLGKKEDGIKENLKVKFKNTNSGLGFKDDSYANVMKTEYESILKDLRAEYPHQENVNDCNTGVEHKNKDLKQKSRIVKSKIRYPKLYYGKDVSKYSEKDMKSIFICSLPSKDNEEERAKDSEVCLKKESEKELPKLHESYTSHLSISDYFNLKMKEKKNNEHKKTSSGKIKQEDAGNYCNTINCEVKQEKFDVESDKTDFKIKEENSDFECNEISCKIGQENNQHCITENAMTSLSKKKHKKKRKYSEVSMNSEDKSLLSLVEKDVATSNKKRKRLAEQSLYEETVSDEKKCEKPSIMADQLSVLHRKRKKSHKTENLSTPTNSEELSSQPIIDTDLKPKKKRKKSHRNEGDTTVGEAELVSVSSLNDEVLENSELLNNHSSSGSLAITDENSSNINNSQTKEKKKLKNKLNSLKKLKSCLKSKSKEYTVKNVSFHDEVSYRIIDSDCEFISSISECQNKVVKDCAISASDKDTELEKDIGNNETEIQDSSLSEQNGTNYSNASSTTEEEETKKCDSLSSLPSSNSSYYNSWVESQYQAFKMKLYKNLLNGIKKHDVFKATNLLKIKGYGNWGF